ncbi:hypothetical protein ACIQOU_31500 [Streptomyces sp. NPDC091279]|uniref:hypothetical protein n=1 Tax=unclassified Streptomyces TaxID=2593676 RepID=UPI0038169EA2
MRLSRSLAPVGVAVALLLSLSYEAAPHARVKKPAPERPFGAECHTRVTGSHVSAYCHNPYPETDRVSLHIKCAHWWDLNADGSPVDAGPAATVRLTGRCWKEIGVVWISHQKR